MTRILITGVTGMVGSHLAEYLLKEQKHCRVFGAKRWRSNLENILQIKDNIEIFDADLTDQSACMSLLEAVRPDIIFHLAANTYVLVSGPVLFTKHCMITSACSSTCSKLSGF